MILKTDNAEEIAAQEVANDFAGTTDITIPGFQALVRDILQWRRTDPVDLFDCYADYPVAEAAWAEACAAENTSEPLKAGFVGLYPETGLKIAPCSPDPPNPSPSTPRRCLATVETAHWAIRVFSCI